MTQITGKGVAGEEDPRLHGAAEQQLLQGEVTERRGLSSSPSRDEDETSRVSSPQSHSFASAGDNASFRSSVSSSFSSTSSLRSDVESYYGDGTYPWTHCECEEIPSYRWIASSLRWWKPRKGSDLSKMNSAVDAPAANRLEGGAAVGKTSMVPSSTTSEGLVHFDLDPTFELEDLRRAKKKDLGKGTVGCPVFKATLSPHKSTFTRNALLRLLIQRKKSPIDKSSYPELEVAVRSLKWAKTVKDFKAEADMQGRIRHPNLLALKAYYYSPEHEGEKFLVYEYMPHGTLSASLHGQRPRPPIDWPARMKIAIGAARGLHHLHTQVNMIHGNLSSRNILLDNRFNAKIADYGLSKLLTTTTGSNTPGTDWKSGCQAPELSELKKANTKTDVYSLGVIMVELITGLSPRKHDDFKMINSDPLKNEMTPRLFCTLQLALECVNFIPDERPDVQEVLQRLEWIESALGRSFGAITVKRRNKATDEGEGAAGAAAITTLDREKRTASSSEDSEEENFEPSNVIGDDGSLLRPGMTENMISKSTSACGLKENETPSTGSAEEVTRDPPGNKELQAPPVEDLFAGSSSSQLEGSDETFFTISMNMNEATTEDRTGEVASADEPDVKFGRTMACQLPGIDWAKAAIEVRLQVPTSPPLFNSEPDLIYQRYLRTLSDLAYRSPPLSSDLLELQLNKMSIGLQSLGYPMDTWLKVATLLLVFTKKREYAEDHVDSCKAHLEAQLEEVASEIDPIKEEVSRVQSSITALQQKQEDLDEAISGLEDQLELLKAQKEEVAGSLSTARYAFAAAVDEMNSVFVHKDHLDKQYSMLPDFQKAIFSELPSLDEVFDSSFQEILTKEF